MAATYKQCDVCGKFDRCSNADSGICRACSNKLKYNNVFNELLKILGPICNCCGENNKEFLTLDHVNNDGYLIRNNKGRNTCYYVWLKALSDSNIRKNYQILCWNCNSGRAKQSDKICPHQKFDYMSMVSVC